MDGGCDNGFRPDGGKGPREPSDTRLASFSVTDALLVNRTTLWNVSN